MEKKTYLLNPTDVQKEKIEDTFIAYMNIYNSLIEYSKSVGKENALQYSTKPKLYKYINNMKYNNKKLSIIDNSTMEYLVDTYIYDLDKSIKKNRRFPMQKIKMLLHSYPLNNKINKTTVDFYNTDYVKITRLGYVKTNSNVNIPIDCSINKAIVMRDKSSNYMINIEYDNNKSDTDRENRKNQFLECYAEGKFPNGENISNDNSIIKKQIKYTNKYSPINTVRNVHNNFIFQKPKKKHIVSINYIHRDYVKKLDEYNYAQKLYKKHPEKFSRGVLFGHTIIKVKDDGVDFDVIYDPDPLSSYRKWNVPMPEKEKEIIKRKCQDRVLRFFPEIFENYQEKKINKMIENIQNQLLLEENQQQEQKLSTITQQQDQNIEEQFHDYDLSDVVEDFVVKDIDELEEKDSFIHVSEDDELAQLLLQSNVKQYNPGIAPQYNFQPKYQISGNTNWQYNNNYYNSQW